jgi:hypothetical protein
MKKCSFCAEEIQSEALKCKHCGSRLKMDVVNTQSIVQTNWKRFLVTVAFVILEIILNFSLAWIFLGVFSLFIVPLIMERFKLKDKKSLNGVVGVGSAQFKGWLIAIGAILLSMMILGLVASFFE